MVRATMWFLLSVPTLVVGKGGKAEGSGGKNEPPTEEKKVGESISIEAPVLTEEDTSGYRLPKQYECDGCHGVVHQINAALKEESKKGKELKSWDLIEIFEKTCANAFSDYGVSKVNGKTVLQGPGIENEKDLEGGQASMKMGGGKWPGYLKALCIKLVEEIGEEELHALYKKDKLGKSLCRHEDLKYCKKEKKEKKQKEEKKQKDKERAKDEEVSKQKDKESKKSQKLTISQFLVEQENLLHGAYSEFGSPKTSEEWLKLFKRIVQGPREEL